MGHQRRSSQTGGAAIRARLAEGAEAGGGRQSCAGSAGAGGGRLGARRRAAVRQRVPGHFGIILAGVEGAGADRGNRGVSVVLFAGAREAAGTGRVTLDCAGASVAELLARLAASYGPALGQVVESSRTWLNGAPAAPDDIVRAGDEVAVLPPVSGG